MITQSVNIVNLPALRRRIEDMNGGALAGAFQGALYLLSCDIATRAMRLCPVDTGFLRSSRYVTKPGLSTGSFVIVVGFSATYAMAVHERKAYHVVGEWKYLTKAYAEAESATSSFLQSTTMRFVAAKKTIDNITALQPVAPTLETHSAIGKLRLKSPTARRNAARRARAVVRARRELSAGRHG